MKYWDVTVNEYEELIKNTTGSTWNFKDEATKYCKLDCVCLQKILIKFNETMFKEFNLNIHSSLTAPSLAMRLFKSNFMVDGTLYSLHGKIEQNIRQSYTGGAVDVYIPHNKIGSFFSKTFRKLYYYDVNSLYPTVMQRGDMPIGLPIAFEGDIRAVEPNAFGFFYCKITSPANLKHPILQRKVETNEGLRTIAGLGTWNASGKGWIYSPELDNAVNYGYTYEIIKGYQFDKGNIFLKKEFVDTMYNLRQKYSKDHPMNLVAKLMMNSLYGMKDQLTVVEIFAINNEEDVKAFKQLIDLWGNTIHSWVVLDGHLVVTRDKILDLRTESEENIYYGTEINIAIASAITSSARVIMSHFKNNTDFNLYYSDMPVATDSVIINKPLPSHLVGSELGQLKLEYVIKKAVFLAPKVYSLITDDEKEIIRIKGITQKAIDSENINFTSLLSLLTEDSTREFNQEKWYKNILAGTITVSDIAYTLKATSNKRQAIYIDGIYEKTTPYQYSEIETSLHRR